MRLIDLVRTPRRLQRLSQIVQALVRHGFGHMVYSLKLHQYLPGGKRLLEKYVPIEERPLAARIVQVFQELGPLYVKLGQMLSTRPDIIPEDFIREFRSLQKDVRPFDPKVSKATIEEELKAPISSLFVSFQDEPIACGSIAQVHAATLKKGKAVVVKVKRPGIDQIIWSDLDLLAIIAERAERIEELAVFRPGMLIEEFYRVIQNELDFITEASNTSKFYRLYQNNPRVRVPQVYWDLSTSNVLTLERIKDISLTDLETLEEKGVDKKKLAMELLENFMGQYFKAGVFHADPHPGNLMVSGSGALSMIDFGMVGYVNEELKGRLSTALFALLRKDIDLFTEIFIDIGAIPIDGRLEALKNSLHETMEKFLGIPMKRIDPRRAFFDTMKVARDYRLVFPRDFVLLGKSFVTITNMAMELDPNLDLQAVITPFARGLMRERLSPQHLSKMAREGSWHLANLVYQGPKEVRLILKKLLNGKVEVALKHVELESFAYELDRASNRLALSIILASTVIASSLVMMAGVGPMVMKNVSLLGVLGYLFASVMGIWLIIGIFRSGRL